MNQSLGDAGESESDSRRQIELVPRARFVLVKVVNHAPGRQQRDVPEIQKPRHRCCAPPPPPPEPTNKNTHTLINMKELRPFGQAAGPLMLWRFLADVWTISLANSIPRMRTLLVH